MHRGSSKGSEPTGAGPETLPLSAFPPSRPITVVLEVVRAGHSVAHTLESTEGTLLRQLLRTIGQAAEGCAVLDGDRPVPLDLPITASVRLTVVPTFSGG